MKLLFRGGLNKYDPQGWEKSYFYEYSKTIHKLVANGLKVCFVTMAKPDRYYDKYIIPQFGKKVDIIGHKTTNVDWSVYDLIFLCGGDTILLKAGLAKKNFKLKHLKDNIVILGDSAGAMLLAPYFYDTKDRVNVKFLKGIYKKTNTIIIVHVNNPRYTNKVLVEKIEKFAMKRNLNTLKLKENETKLYNENTGQFANINFEGLFGNYLAYFP
jgi:peptidase E